MQSEKSFRVRGLFLQDADRDGRRVAREESILSDHRFYFPKYLFLDVKVLDGAFDHELAGRERLVVGRDGKILQQDVRMPVCQSFLL